VVELATTKLFCRITGSISSPNEDRLLKHLFDPQYQTNNVMTTPVNSSS